MDIKSINWPMIQSVVTGMTITQQRWTTKFTTGFCTTRQIMQRWGQRESVLCLQCNHETETMGHILQCPNTPAQEIGDRNTKELRAILKNLETDQDTMEDLSAGFSTWSSDKPLPQMLTDVSWLQSSISWDNEMPQIYCNQLADPAATVLWKLPTLAVKQKMGLRSVKMDTQACKTTMGSL